MQPRPSSFEAPHKGIRAFFGSVLKAAGNADHNDPQEIDALCTNCEELFELLHLHASDENGVVLTHLDRKVAGASEHDRNDHDRLEKMQADLELLVKEIRKGPVQVQQLNKLYAGLSLLFSEHLEHMHEEETVTQELLWQHFTDEELFAMRGEIMQRLGPDRMLKWWKHIMPALRRSERAMMLGAVFAQAPPPFVEKVKALLPKWLGEKEWQRTQELMLQPA
jgi:hypothetical protein